MLPFIRTSKWQVRFKRAEVDFILEQEDGIYPLEVNLGNSSKKKSLHVYNDIYRPKQLIRTSPINLKKDGDILNYPLYLMEKLRDLLTIT